jgi:hypothetical protein
MRIRELNEILRQISFIIDIGNEIQKIKGHSHFTKYADWQLLIYAVFYLEPPHMKYRSDATGDLKNLKNVQFRPNLSFKG